MATEEKVDQSPREQNKEGDGGVTDWVSMSSQSAGPGRADFTRTRSAVPLHSTSRWSVHASWLRRSSISS